MYIHLLYEYTYVYIYMHILLYAYTYTFTYMHIHLLHAYSRPSLSFSPCYTHTQAISISPLTS